MTRPPFELLRPSCPERAEAEALEYAILCHSGRRSLCDAEVLRAVMALDRKREPGRPSRESAQRCANLGKSARDTARLVNVCPRKVEQIRTILEHGTPELRQEIERGGKSIHRAYLELQHARRDAEQNTVTSS